MMIENFFSSALSAGAILTGFCCTFLSFRLQRESNYYRQIVVDYKEKAARDIYIGLTHFTGPLFLLLLATLTGTFFGFVLPLLCLAHPGIAKKLMIRIVASGEISALIFLLGYFIGELVHYKVLTIKLANDSKEWGRQWPVVLTTFTCAIVFFIAIFCYF